MNLLEHLRAQVAAHPDKPAILERDGSVLTFADLERRSAGLAGVLHARGVRAGDAVMVLVPMSGALYVTLAAVFRLGAVVMVVDPASGLEHVQRCCALNPPKALVGSGLAHWLSLLVPALRSVPVRVTTRGWFPGSSAVNAAVPPLEGIAAVTADAPALLTFTSGTTGTPKAALRTHGLLLAQFAALESLLEPIDGDVDLATLPIVALANLGAGVTTVMPDANLRRPARLNPQPILGQIARHRITRTAASPALLERLADHALEREITLPGLTRIFSGGGPVFPRVLYKLYQVAPNARLYSVYGSTEAEPIAHIEYSDMKPDDFDAMRGGHGLLVGKPVPEITLRVVSPQSLSSGVGLEAATLPASEIGEIVVSGAHVLPGYLHGRGDSETKVRVNGRIWHRTGDAGSLDAQGRLWLAGRVNARISDAHGVIYPFSVECAALEVDGVQRCAFLEFQNKRLLCVEWDGKPEPDVLLERLDWAHVDEVRDVKALPMDSRHNAKVDLKRLRALLER
jgi:acyl-CoA synthetase (AMP-forming)/AMP-acid ligase II